MLDAEYCLTFIYFYQILLTKLVFKRPDDPISCMIEEVKKMMDEKGIIPMEQPSTETTSKDDEDTQQWNTITYINMLCTIINLQSIKSASSSGISFFETGFLWNVSAQEANIFRWLSSLRRRIVI